MVGENAQGKTNLLEAIYYLESLRSFRGAGDSELVAFEESTFHLRGLVEVDGERTTTVRTASTAGRRRKKVAVDGKETERIVDGLGLLGAVVFSPSDVNLVNGGPRLRRRFLDVALSLNGSEYLGTLSRYRRALANRNAALRAAARPRAVGAWDDGLVFEGARVTHMRRAWVADWSGRLLRLRSGDLGPRPGASGVPSRRWTGAERARSRAGPRRGTRSGSSSPIASAPAATRTAAGDPPRSARIATSCSSRSRPGTADRFRPAATAPAASAARPLSRCALPRRRRFGSDAAIPSCSLTTPSPSSTRSARGGSWSSSPRNAAAR